MACGCSETCLCYIEGDGSITVVGDGSAGDPYIVTGSSETTFTATNTGGGLDITPGGVAGHAPNIDLVIDPASTAPVSVSGAGLLVDCCPAGALPIDTVAVNTLLDPSMYTVLVESDAGAVTILLPALHTAGERYEIKDFGNGGLGFTETNAVNVDPNGNLIDGSASVRTFISNGESMTVVSNGTNWAII